MTFTVATSISSSRGDYNKSSVGGGGVLTSNNGMLSFNQNVNSGKKF